MSDEMLRCNVCGYLYSHRDESIMEAWVGGHSTGTGLIRTARFPATTLTWGLAGNGWDNIAQQDTRELDTSFRFVPRANVQKWLQSPPIASLGNSLMGLSHLDWNSIISVEIEAALTLPTWSLLDMRKICADLYAGSKRIVGAVTCYRAQTFGGANITIESVGSVI